MLRVTDSWKRCSRAGTIFNLREAFTYYDWTLVPLNLCNLKLSLLADSLDCLYFRQTHLTTFCLFPVIVYVGIVRVENCPSGRAPFRKSVARNMARLDFWRTDRKDKTIIKTNFPFQYTLLNIPNDGGLDCTSDGI